MRLTAMLLLVACLQVSARGIGQTVTLSQKDATLKVIFNEIQRQTGYNFFFKSSWLSQAKRVTIEVKNAPVKKALDLCFKDQPFSYAITGESIVVKPNEKFSEEDLPAEADTINVNVWGKVLNERGEPIIGASVLVKTEPSFVITTDETGTFHIEKVREFTNVVISNVGYQPAEVKLTRKIELTVILKFSVIELGDVNVTINNGYQELHKSNMTGSVVKINNELFNRKIGSNILTRLDGISSGILFDKRELSYPTNIQIRGLYTLTANISQPLVILDNFPYEGDINDINPNDIEDVTVLKDAAAASIWGAKAGNGVIVFTTKKGKYNQPLTTSFIANTTIVSKPDLFKIPELPSGDYIDLEKYLFEKGQYDWEISDPLMPVSPVVQILDDVRSGKLSAQEGDAQINMLRSKDVRNDFEKYIYRESLQQQYMVNVAGGSSTVKYFFSGGYDKNLESLKGNDFRRITIRSENTFSPVKKLQLRVGLSYVITDKNNNSPGEYGTYNVGYRRIPIYSQLADSDGNPLPIDQYYKSTFTDMLDPNLLDWKYRPLQELDNNDRNNRSGNFMTDLGIRYEVAKSLTAEIQYRYQNVSGEEYDYNSTNTYMTRNLINMFTSINGTEIDRPVPHDGILDYTSSRMVAHALRGQLNFHHKWKDRHSLTMIGGGEIRSRTSGQNDSRTYGYNKDRFGTTNIDYVNYYPLYTGSQGIIPSRTGRIEYMDRFVSAYGNASYTLLDKYTVFASARQDASNLFGVKSNNKWQPLWAAGAAWNISKERFYKSKNLPYLNLRWSYGYSGNVNNAIPALTTTSIRPASWQITNLPFAVILNYPNPELRWEKVRTINMGIDFGIGDNILTGSLEYYRKKSLDVLGTNPLDPTVGITTLQTNSANLTGSGLDFQLATKDLGNGFFKWRTNFSFSFVEYKLSRYLFPTITDGFVSEGKFIFPIEGYNPYLVVSYRWAGLDPLTGDPQGYIGNKISKNYDSIRFYTPLADQHIHGSALPKYYGNFLNTLSWKGFSISANITYRLGYFFKKPALNYSTLIDQNWLGDYEYVNRWQKPGDEAHTNVPSFTYPANGMRDGFYGYAEINFHNAGQIRLEDIRLNYSLNRHTQTNMPFKHCQFYANMSNLNILLWKANSVGIDPEYPGGLLPPRAFTLGFNITL